MKLIVCRDLCYESSAMSEFLFLGASENSKLIILTKPVYYNVFCILSSYYLIQFNLRFVIMGE